MSRQIVLDTETTGLSAEGGDRIIELGCVELLNRKLTGNNLHLYFNPGRDSHEDALKVHGITSEFLRDKPKFAEVAQEVLDYLAGAEIIIHNAAFDVGFLNAELKRLGRQPFHTVAAKVTDTLLMAREMFPGKANSLDALCRRLGVDNAQRQLHGALLDAQLLTDVYLAMTSGQSELGLSPAAGGAAQAAAKAKTAFETTGERPRVRVDAEESKEHQARLQALQKKSGRCLWLELEAAG